MVDAAIDRVRVYRRGATVFRRVSVPAGEAKGEVEIPGLPLSLADATVQVRSLTDGIVSGAVRIGLHARPPEETPDTPDEVALRTVERRIASIDRALAGLEAESDLLRGLEVPARPEGEEGKPPPASPMRARVALDQFADEAIQARLDEARALRRERSVKSEEAAALRDAIERASAARKARPDQITKTVLVELSGTASGPVALELEYYVPGARWAPQYQCDIAPDGSEARLELRALVCQASGEDWKAVTLELSTAEPLAFTELPELGSIRIGKVQPVPPSRGYRDPPAGAAALYADFDRGRARAQSLVPSQVGFSLPYLDVDPLESPPAFEVRTRDYGRGGAEKYAAMDVDEDDMELEEAATEEAGFGGMAVGAARLMAPQASAAAPPPAPKGAGRQMAKRKAAKPGMLREEAQLPPEPDEPGLHGPSVAFARLRLPPATSGQRGMLREVGATDDYLPLLLRSGLAVSFDVEQLVQQATRAAQRAGELSLPSDAVDVGRSSGSFDYAYTADDRVDVPSDLAFHSVPLGTRVAPCEVTYVVVPRVDTNVFRVAEVHNPTEAPLLPGPAEVYVGGEYVLSTALPMVAPRARFELGLGVEQALRCARNTRFREERSGQNVVAMAELHHEIDIELHNPLGRTVRCVVRERIPQPDKDAEVDVEELAVEPPWEPWDQIELGRKLEGGRRWTLEVPARSQAALKAHYVVKIYANNALVGGNRREA